MEDRIPDPDGEDERISEEAYNCECNGHGELALDAPTQNEKDAHRRDKKESIMKEPTKKEVKELNEKTKEAEVTDKKLYLDDTEARMDTGQIHHSFTKRGARENG